MGEVERGCGHEAHFLKEDCKTLISPLYITNWVKGEHLVLSCVHNLCATSTQIQNYTGTDPTLGMLGLIHNHVARHTILLSNLIMANDDYSNGKNG